MYIFNCPDYWHYTKFFHTIKPNKDCLYIVDVYYITLTQFEYIFHISQLVTQIYKNKISNIDPDNMRTLKIFKFVMYTYMQKYEFVQAYYELLQELTKYKGN